MITVLIICIVIVSVVLLLAVLTTSKAYQYEHKVDSIDNNPHLYNDASSDDCEKKENASS